ncbi:MAG TPA: hypothetical protein VHL77_02280, partial [Ferruginibacter sp.]|nr:hypothetical protein [Ferruginibacter sp.]
MKNALQMPGMLWILLSFVCLAVILFGLYKALLRIDHLKTKRRKIFIMFTVSISVWLCLLSVLAYNDFFKDFSKFPPRPALAILIPLPFVSMFAFSRTGTKILQAVPAQWLVTVQSFRIL